MKTFARAIAAIFMILGVIIIMIGVGVVVSGFLGATSPKPATSSFIPDLSGFVLIAKLIAGAAIGFQGLMLSAIGEVLWLLAAISEQTQRTSDYMANLLRRVNPPKQ